MSQDNHFFPIMDTLLEDFSLYQTPLLQAEEFERFEDKYLVPLAHKDELLELLLLKSRPSYLTPATSFLTIESSYYDSPGFQSYRDHFLGKPYRYKLRTRRYFANDQPNQEPANLELKSKDGETSRKIRFKADESDLQRLGDFLPIRVSSSLVAMNKTIPGDELRRRAKQISRLVTEDRLSPVCRVTYHRQAFERKGVRVTVDTDIQSELLRPLASSEVYGQNPQIRDQAVAMVERFRQQPFALLEVKHRGVIPRWLDRFTSARTTGKTGFSKYCYSMTSMMAPGVN